MTAVPPISPGALLRHPAAGRPIETPGHLWGFGGLHGGLTLALLVAAMRRSASGPGRLQSATARLHRPLTSAFSIRTEVLRPGRVTALGARTSTGDEALATPEAEASALFAPERPAVYAPVSPVPPEAPPPEDCELFAIPPEFVPISVYMEIRPVGPNRPYAGCAEPELTAWIRLTEDDEPPDEDRFILLMDALAPSYAAVLTDLQFVPTLELTVRPGAGLAQASSPWVLLQARTRSADPAGWVDEHIDAWDLKGVHLGSASQLRIVRSIPSA